MVAADSDSDGISVAANAIRLNGGSIKAAADGTTDADGISIAANAPVKWQVRAPIGTL